MVDWFTIGFIALGSILILFVLSKFFRIVGRMINYIRETFSIFFKVLRPVTRPAKRFVRRYKYKIKRKLRN